MFGKNSKSEANYERPRNSFQEIFKRKKKKELRIFLHDSQSEDDFFQLQYVSDQDITLIAHIKALTLIMRNFIDVCREYDIKKPPKEACHSLSVALVGIIIELTAMQRSSFAISYKELEQYSLFAKAKSLQQKFIIEQNVVQMLHRILLNFWKNIFKKLYGPERPENQERLQALQKDTEQAEKACKLAHLALKLIVQNNKKAVQSVIEVDFLGLMLEQIQTQWKMCYNELIINPFIRDASSGINLQILQRAGIKSLVDQLHKAIQKGKYVKNIIELLGTISTPGDKTDKKLQELVFEMIIGFDRIPDAYYKLNKQESFQNEEANKSVFLFQVQKASNSQFEIIVNAQNLRRPTYYEPDFKNKNLKLTQYNTEMRMGKETEKYSIEEILADLDNPSNRKNFKQKQSYFLAQIRLFTILCQDYKKESQIIIQKLVPPEFILEVLRSQVLLGYKRFFVELLTNLYINYFNMVLPAKTLMPEILLWNDKVEENQQQKKVAEEIEKVFTLQALKKRQVVYLEETFEDDDLIEVINDFQMQQKNREIRRISTMKKEELDGKLIEREENQEEFKVEKVETSSKYKPNKMRIQISGAQEKETDWRIKNITKIQVEAFLPKKNVSLLGLIKKKEILETNQIQMSFRDEIKVKEQENEKCLEILQDEFQQQLEMKEKEDLKDIQIQEKRTDERRKTIYSIKNSVKELVQTYKNRLALHHFVTSILKEEDFYWNTLEDANQRSDSKQDFFLSFFISFLKMVEILIRRGFFDEGYDSLIEEAIRKYCPEEFNGLKPRDVPYIDEALPDYILNMRTKIGGQHQIYSEFYLHLKFNLMEKLRTTRPQYFHVEDIGDSLEVNLKGGSAKQEKEEFKRSLEHRLDCYDSESILISKIMNVVSSIIYLIYDHYQSQTLTALWKVYRKIAHQWVEDRRKENDAELLNSNTNDFSPEIINKSFQFRRPGTQKSPLVSLEIDNSKILKTEPRQNDSYENLKNTEFEGPKVVGKQNNLQQVESIESVRSLSSGDEEDGLFQENSRVKLIEFKKLNPENLEQAKKPIEKFIYKYLGGFYDHFALGKQKQLQEDDLVQLMTDLLYYNDNKLTTQAMDLIFRHFNQFQTLVQQLDNALLLFDQEEYETYIHIRQLKQKFSFLSGAAVLSDEMQTLLEVAAIFQSPKNQCQSPSLIEICYTSFWGQKCKFCLKWWRDRKQSNTQETAEEAKQNSKKLAESCNQSHKRYMQARTEESNIGVREYKVTSRDIMAKNQYLIEKLKIQKDIMRFLTDMTCNLTQEQIENFKASPIKISIIQKCYKFLLCFCKDNKRNKISLCKKEYFKVFIYHLGYEWLKKLVINFIIEILDDNDFANQLLSEEQIKNFCYNLFQDSENLKLKTMKILKNLTDNNLGVKRDRQTLIIGAIRKIQIKGEDHQEKDMKMLKNWISIYKSEEQEEFYDVLATFSKKGGLISHSCEELEINIPENVNLHLEFVDLIGVCAKGKNLAAEMFAAKLLPLEKICKIILTPDPIPLEFQSVYLRALHCIYFSTEISEKSNLNNMQNSGTEALLTICLENIQFFMNILANFTLQMNRVSDLYDQKLQMIEHGVKPNDYKAKSMFNLTQKISKKLPLEDRFVQLRKSKTIQAYQIFKYDFDDLLLKNNTYVFEIMIPFIQDLVTNHLESIISHLIDYYQILDGKVKPGNRLKSNKEKIMAIANDQKIKAQSIVQAKTISSQSQSSESDYESPPVLLQKISISTGNKRKSMIAQQRNLSFNSSNANIQEIKAQQQELEEDERKIKAIQEIFKIVLKWTEAALKLSKYDFIVSRMARREALINFLTAVARKKQVAKQTMIDERNLNQINKAIEDLRKKGLMVISEDLEHQNQQSLENFIKKQCIPMMNKTTKKILQKHILKKNFEGQIKVKLLEKELGQDIFPEFLGFVDFFRAKLLRYCFYMQQEQDMSQEMLSSFLPKITYKGQCESQNIQTVVAAKIIKFKYRQETYHLQLHQDFDEFTKYESKLFQNIFKILRNLEVRAKQITDIGFVKLFQSILLLQGATIRVKVQVGGGYERFIFEMDKKTEKPKNLEKVQNRLVECGSLELVSNMIAISYQNYKKDCSDYFEQILSASINLGSTLLSYGNKQIQNQIVKSYKTALKVTSICQYFLLGIKQLLRRGFERLTQELKKEKEKQTQNMLLSLLLFLQNLCEDGNKENKNFLRFQNLSFSDLDLVSEVALFGDRMLETVAQNIKYLNEEEQPTLFSILDIKYISNPERSIQLIDYFASERLPKMVEMKLIIQCYRTLIEFCQGPIRGNQDVLSNHKFVQESIRFLNFTGAFFFNQQKLNSEMMEELPFRGDNMEDLFRIIVCAVVQNENVANEVPQAQKYLPDSELQKDEIAEFSIPKNIEKLGGDLLKRYELLELNEAKQKKKYDSLLLSVENTILVLLQSLIEGRMVTQEEAQSENQGNDKIAGQILELLDIDVYLNNLDNYYQNAKFLPLSTYENRFLYFSLLSHLLEIENGNTDEGKKIFDQFKHWKDQKRDIKEEMGRIEFLNEQNQLELLFFRIPEQIRLHWRAPLIEKVREEILKKIKLDNPEEKVRSFLDLSDKLILAVYHQANIAKIKDYVPALGWVIYIFISNRRFFNILSMIVSLALNLIIINVLIGPKECLEALKENPPALTEDNPFGQAGKILPIECNNEFYEDFSGIILPGFFRFLQWINALILTIITLDHCINNMHLNIMEYILRAKERKQKIKMLGLIGAEQMQQRFMLSRYIFGFLKVSILDPMFIFLVLLTVAAYYGINHHAFLAVCLALPITENETLNKVINAVGKHADQLIYTILLGVMILYWYSIIAFFNWPGEFQFEGIVVECESLYTCFRVMVDYGFAVFPFWETTCPCQKLQQFGTSLIFSLSMQFLQRYSLALSSTPSQLKGWMLSLERTSKQMSVSSVRLKEKTLKGMELILIRTQRKITTCGTTSRKRFSCKQPRRTSFLDKTCTFGSSIRKTIQLSSLLSEPYKFLQARRRRTCIRYSQRQHRSLIDKTR